MFHFFSFWFFIGFLIDMNSYPDMGFFYESLFEIRSGYTNCIGEGSELITQGQKSTCFISFLPFLNSSLSSFALMNLLVFYLLYFYLYASDCFTKFSEIIYLFLPSIFLYSSLPLKEFLIFTFTIIFIFETLIFKRIILIFVSGFLLYILKIQNVFILAASYAVFFLVKLIYRKEYILFFLVSIGIITFYFLFKELFPTKNYDYYSLASISIAKKSIGIENGIKYIPYDTINFEFIYELFLGFFKYFIFPTFINVTNLDIKIYFVFENIFFTIIVVYLLFRSLFKYNFNHFYLDFSLISFATLYGYVNFNYFNMHRYAFSITLVYIIIKLYLLKRNYEIKN